MAVTQTEMPEKFCTPEAIARIRSESPACESVLHFDHASALLMPDAVFYTVAGHLTLERRMGGYPAEGRAAPALPRWTTTLPGCCGLGRMRLRMRRAQPPCGR
jgi:hypothetical protein